MPKRPRNNKAVGSCWWYQVGRFVVVSLAMSTAQDYVTSEKHHGNNDNDIQGLTFNNAEQRKSMLQQRESMRQSHQGTRYWNGLEENGVDLPLFGLSHYGNRRKIRSSTAANLFSRENLDSVSASGRSGRYETSSNTKSSKKSSSKGGSKGGKGSQPGPRPNPRPPRPPGPSPPTGAESCTKVITLDFLQLSAIPPALFVNPADPNEQTLGTRYVYNDGLRDQDTLDELTDSNVAGTCTRTQARVGNPTIGLQLGGGTCQFTYTLRDSRNREIVFTASGEVVDSLGGILSITGGSRSALGAYGEIELLPVNLQPDGDFDVATGDFFLDPLFYVADATVIVPCDH